MGAYLVESEGLGKILVVILGGGCEWYASERGSRLSGVHWKLLHVNQTQYTEPCMQDAEA